MTDATDRPATLTRRGAILAAAGLAAAGRAGPALADPPSVTLGILQFGSVQWVADVIRRHRLDAAHEFVLRTTLLANNDAGRIALLAGSADVVVSDWPFVAVQCAAGTALRFARFSNASGAVMVASSSPVHTLADLKGRKLGVAGGPADKSWLVVQAAARAQGLDLAHQASLVYGAPPLLAAKLQQGELDAALIFWTFAARLEAEGFRQAFTVADCATALGLKPDLGLLGYVFHAAWADQNRAAIDGFLAAAAAAERMLAAASPDADAEWAALRPLMQAPDDALFASLRRRFSAGVATPPDAAAQEAAAKSVFDILLRTGGTTATGGLTALPPGMFWRDAGDGA